MTDHPTSTTEPKQAGHRYCPTCQESTPSVRNCWTVVDTYVTVFTLGLWALAWPFVRQYYCTRCGTRVG